METFRSMVNDCIRIGPASGSSALNTLCSETRDTSKLCRKCGEGLQEDRVRKRELCSKCKKWQDRDVIAFMNISYKGWVRFRQSLKGEASEAMVQEPHKEGVILKVDASKLTRSHVQVER